MRRKKDYENDFYDFCFTIDSPTFLELTKIDNIPYDNESFRNTVIAKNHTAKEMLLQALRFDIAHETTDSMRDSKGEWVKYFNKDWDIVFKKNEISVNYNLRNNHSGSFLIRDC